MGERQEGKKMREEYRPEPIDTSDVELPEELTEVMELLAKNTHEIWAKERIAEGWSYGPRRDDKAMTSPCIVPYEELPDEEKEYDRRTSRQVLEVLWAMGYRLAKE